MKQLHINQNVINEYSNSVQLLKKSKGNNNDDNNQDDEQEASSRIGSLVGRVRGTASTFKSKFEISMLQKMIENKPKQVEYQLQTKSLKNMLKSMDIEAKNLVKEISKR